MVAKLGRLILIPALLASGVADAQFVPSAVGGLGGFSPLGVGPAIEYVERIFSTSNCSYMLFTPKGGEYGTAYAVPSRVVLEVGPKTQTGLLPNPIDPNRSIFVAQLKLEYPFTRAPGYRGDCSPISAKLDSERRRLPFSVQNGEPTNLTVDLHEVLGVRLQGGSVPGNSTGAPIRWSYASQHTDQTRLPDNGRITAYFFLNEADSRAVASNAHSRSRQAVMSSKVSWATGIETLGLTGSLYALRVHARNAFPTKVRDSRGRVRIQNFYQGLRAALQESFQIVGNTRVPRDRLLSDFEVINSYFSWASLLASDLARETLDLTGDGGPPIKYIDLERHLGALERVTDLREGFSFARYEYIGAGYEGEASPVIESSP